MSVSAADPPRPGRRKWVLVVVVGVLLVAAGELYTGLSLALYDYGWYRDLFFPNGFFGGLALVEAIGSSLVGLGALLAGVGWVLDRRELQRATLGSPPSTTSPRRAGPVLVILGVAVIAFGELYAASIAWLDLLRLWGAPVNNPVEISLTYLWALVPGVTNAIGLTVALVGWLIYQFTPRAAPPSPDPVRAP